MKYAVISDIHGNFDALKAVLKDAESEKVDHYIFLGDLIGDFHQPNEVLDTIKNIPNCSVVRGNKEDYIKELAVEDSSTCTKEQFFPIYWNYNELLPKNREYIDQLPEKISIDIADNQFISMTHASINFMGYSKADDLDGWKFTKLMKTTPLTHQEYLEYAHLLLANDEIFQDGLAMLPDGVILFGHRHSQWHTRFENKTIVNPGACGMSNDMDTCAPYTIINFNNYEWTVKEKRIFYDTEDMIQKYKKSSFYTTSKVWGELNVMALRSGENQTLPFLGFLNEVAIELGDASKPVSNKTWLEAGKRWLK